MEHSNRGNPGTASFRGNSKEEMRASWRVKITRSRIGQKAFRDFSVHSNVETCQRFDLLCSLHSHKIRLAIAVPWGCQTVLAVRLVMTKQWMLICFGLILFMPFALSNMLLPVHKKYFPFLTISAEAHIDDITLETGCVRFKTVLRIASNGKKTFQLL